MTPETSGRCPICNEPRDAAYRPFCSKRCADIDLGRWMRGSYAIPIDSDSDGDGDNPGMAVSPIRSPDD